MDAYVVFVELRICLCISTTLLNYDNNKCNFILFVTNFGVGVLCLISKLYFGVCDLISKVIGAEWVRLQYLGHRYIFIKDNGSNFKFGMATLLGIVCQMLFWWTKNSLHSINI